MTNKKAVGFSCRFFVTGGGKRDRTADLMIANHSLSQLSYTPSDNADYKESKSTCQIEKGKVNRIKNRDFNRSRLSSTLTTKPTFRWASS